MKKLEAIIPVLIVFCTGCNHGKQSNRFTREEYYPNGSLRSKIEYIQDTIKDGTVIYYYENGQVSSEGRYRKNKKHGKYKDYYLHGIVEEEGFYRDDKPVGSFFYFYNDGTLRLYNALDYVGEAYYVIKFDSTGNKIYEEGMVMSPTMGASLIKERYSVGDSIEIYTCVAEPPGYTPEIQMGLYKYQGVEDEQDLLDSFRLYSIVDGIATYKYTFSTPGHYRIVSMGKLTDSLGAVVREDKAHTDLVVE